MPIRSSAKPIWDRRPLLKLEAVTAGYRGSQVLKGIDLDVPEGRVMALLGRNGMGKSTLLRAIMGLVSVASGRIVMDGTDIANMASFRIANRGIAYVPQGREIFADFTVEENLLLGVLGKANLPPMVPEFVYDYFPVLKERARQKAGTFSGGQQQQLAIARALVGRPKVLLLDEPSEGIQPSIVQQISATLRNVAAEQHLTILLVEQNVDMVIAMTERCAFIENGVLVAAHATDEIARDPDIIHRHMAV